MEAFRASGLDYPRVTVVTDSPRYADQSSGDRAFCYDFSGFRIEISRHALGDSRSCPLNCQWPAVPIGIVTLKNRTLSPVAKLFIDCAREVAKPLAKTK